MSCPEHTPAERTPLIAGGRGGLQRATQENRNSSPGTSARRKEQLDDARLKTKHQNKRPKRALTGAIIFCFLFMIGEIAGGIISHSLAILTDAAHLLTDVGALCLSLLALHLANKESTSKYNFGWHRAEVVGALASIFTIWFLVGAILYEAVRRTITTVHCARDLGRSDCVAVDSEIMLIIGAAGFGVNICCAVILHYGGHSHSHGGLPSEGHSHGDHGHSHGGGHSHGDHGHSHGGGHGHGHGDHQNLNVRAAFLHVIGDCLQSIGVCVAAGFIWYMNWKSTTKKLLHILMETTPPGIDYDQVLEEILEIRNVKDVHDLHIWSLTAGKPALSVHVVSDDHHGALAGAQDVAEHHGILHCTIQVDPVSTAVDRCGSNLQCAN